MTAVYLILKTRSLGPGPSPSALPEKVDRFASCFNGSLGCARDDKVVSIDLKRFDNDSPELVFMSLARLHLLQGIRRFVILSPPKDLFDKNELGSAPQSKESATKLA